MKSFVLMLILTATFAEQINKKKDIEKKPLCERIDVHGKPHVELTVINGVNRPYQLSYYKTQAHGDLVYFSYNVGRQNESSFKIGYVLENGYVPTPVSAVKDGFATAINYADHVIYLGGSEGIYVQDLKLRGQSEPHLLIPKRDIWDLFFKDHLYFIEFPSRRLYKVYAHNKTESVQSHIHEKLYHFVIDGDGDTFLSNKSGLYMIRKDTHHSVHITGAKVFRAFEVNRKGVAYFCGKNEIYVADKEKHSLVEIASIKNIFGLTFDYDDNMYFSDPHRIVKLLPNNCTSSVDHKTPNGTPK
ncbi:ommochrome-binding protein-like [Ostrinia nubilalis]|uniref:ommochrome-binding protein-like n=1 Tax=Ostrinia nubilalis TaxID=29057 RepID=UPI003082222F